MSLIRRMLRSQVTYWSNIGNNAQGQPIFGSPITLRSRWEDCNEELLMPDGSKELSRARVFVGNQVINPTTLQNIPDSFVEVALRGMMFNGLPAQLKDIRNPLNNMNSLGNLSVFKIIKVDKLPNLKYREYLRTIWIN